MNLSELNQKVLTDFAEPLQLIKKQYLAKQALKMAEEAGEVCGCISKEQIDHRLFEEIGDVYVTLAILTAQAGVTPEVCLEAALNKIIKRVGKGKTVNGTFIKEEDC